MREIHCRFHVRTRIDDMYGWYYSCVSERVPSRSLIVKGPYKRDCEANDGVSNARSIDLTVCP